MSFVTRLFVCCVTLPLVAQAPHSGHDTHTGYVPAAVLEAPTSLKANTGPLHDPITTLSPEAQKFYDQGEAYLHSYVWIEAARSFNQALRPSALPLAATCSRAS